MRQFSFYGTNAPKVPCDLTNADGIDEYLKTVKPNRISQRRLEGRFFTYRLDGQRHCTVPARYNVMCHFVSTLGTMNLMIIRGGRRRISTKEEIGMESLVASTFARPVNTSFMASICPHTECCV